MCKRGVFVRTGFSMNCAPFGFEHGLFGFYVCAEMDPSEKNPGHSEGPTVCSKRRCARYCGQGPWTEQASAVT